MRKVSLPRLLVQVALLAVLVGVGVILVGATSYLHLLNKVADYDRVEMERKNLVRENRSLQVAVNHAQEKITNLETLANEVAVSLGLLRLRNSPFGSVESEDVPSGPEVDYADSLARYRFLRHHATALKLYASGVPLGKGQDLEQLR